MTGLLLIFSHFLITKHKHRHKTRLCRSLHHRITCVVESKQQGAWNGKGQYPHYWDHNCDSPLGAVACIIQHWHGNCCIPGGRIFWSSKTFFHIFQNSIWISFWINQIDSWNVFFSGCTYFHGHIIDVSYSGKYKQKKRTKENGVSHRPEILGMLFQ